MRTARNRLAGPESMLSSLTPQRPVSELSNKFIHRLVLFLSTLILTSNVRFDPFFYRSGVRMRSDELPAPFLPLSPTLVALLLSFWGAVF